VCTGTAESNKAHSHSSCGWHSYIEPMTSHVLGWLAGSRQKLLHMQQRAAGGCHGGRLESMTSYQIIKNPPLSVDARLLQEKSGRVIA